MSSVHNRCACLGHFERSKAESRNLFFNRFLHFGPLCGPPVEMTSAQSLITNGCQMHINEFQGIISRKYEERDRERGVPATFLWFIEEVGELATALAGNDQENKQEEFADVLAWLCTLANISNVDLEKACAKYTGKEIKGFKPK